MSIVGLVTQGLLVQCFMRAISVFGRGFSQNPILKRFPILRLP